MQAVHAVFHYAEDILTLCICIMGCCQRLSVCETMPPLICKAVWCLDALSCHPAIVDVNALRPKPLIEVTYPLQHSAVALLPSTGRPIGHLYFDHGSKLIWTLDAVTLEDLG
jgi:hypothetical protein